MRRFGRGTHRNEPSLLMRLERRNCNSSLRSLEGS